MLSAMHFCLIDDDPHLLATLEKGLTELGHACEVFQSSPEGLQRMLDPSRPEPDVLLLDVMMPDLDGWDLLSRFREGGGKTAVIYITARSDVDDRVRGLTLSADDYMIKPFALRELLARAATIMRRQGYSEPIRKGGLLVFRHKPRVEYDGRPVEVSQREHAFLELLFSEPSRVFSRQELLRRLWEINFDPQTNVVEVLVARTRRKLGPEAAQMIETVIGEGYRLRSLEEA